MANCSNPRCTRPKPSESGRCLGCQSLLMGMLVRHRYEIKQTIGRGGFGTTYLILDQDCFNEERILKELRPKPFGVEEDEEDMSVTAERLFKREAQVLLTLQHSGIPKLYAYFTEKDYSYLVQDFILGHTLLEEIDERKKPFDEQEARAALTELADILDYLHTRTPPIVHRDIKPQNLMRHASGKLLLIDFGAVCQAANSATNQTLIGSPGYAPPEQIFGHPVPQSDLYAAGATILRLMSGIHPSQLFNNKTQQMEWESRVQVTREFAAILNDLMARDVPKRMGSAAELKRRLEALTSKPLEIADQAEPELEPFDATDNAGAENSQSYELATALQKKNPLDSNTSLKFGDTQRFKQEEVANLAGSTNQSAPPAAAVPPAASANAKSDTNSKEAEISDSQQYRAKTPPDEMGNFTDTPILFLLRRFYRERMSGSLVATQGSVSKTIYFDQGAIVFANSTLLDERLGEMLMRKGVITQKDFDDATALIRSRGLRFGSALIEIGRITPEELKPLIIEQVSNVVYSIFPWTWGEYKVWRGSPPSEDIKISLSTADIIFEGLRRVENIDLVKRWLGDFTRKLATTTDPLLLYQVVNLNPKEAFIVSRIDSIISVEEILSLGGLPEAETLKTICGLLAVGILEWVDEEQEKRTPTEAVSSVLSQPQALPSDFDIQSAAAFCYEVENTLRTIENASHYAVLGVERGAGEDEIHEAYTHLAKKFHPDRHSQLANYNLSLRGELEKIFGRISEAYRVLGNQRARQEYDSKFRSTGKVKIPEGLADQYRALYSNPEAAKKETPNTGTANRSERPNDRIPLPNTAPARPISASPAPPPTPTLRRDPDRPTPKAGYPIIGTPAKPPDTGSRTASKENAHTWFQKGLEFYNTRQFGHASRAFQAASSAVPNQAEYRIYLARSLAQMKGYYTEAEQEFYKAIELDPKNADYYAELGLFYQKVNLSKQAREMFEKALELVPRHPIAQRAMEQEKESPRR